MSQHDRNGFAWRWDHGRFIHLNREAHGAPLTAVGVSGCMSWILALLLAMDWLLGRCWLLPHCPGISQLLFPTVVGCWGRQEHSVPQTHIPEELVACGLVVGLRHHLQGSGVGGEAEGQEGRRDSLSPCCASALGPLNNGWKGDGKMGSVGGITGHAPIACALSLPDPSKLPPAGTSLGLQSHPWPHGSLSHSFLTHGSLLSQGPASPSLPKSLFPDLWKPEAQVSKVAKQFLPLQIAPVLICFLSLTQPWKPGLLQLGQLTGAVAALPGTQGHPSKYELPVNSAQTFT